MSKNAPWTKLDPLTCRWFKAKQEDRSMTPEEKAWVERHVICCGMTGKRCPPRKPGRDRVI